MSVPTASVTVTTPVVFKVRFDAALAATPLTESRLIAFAMPVPTVSVTPSLIVASPRSIVPVAAPPIVAFAVTVTPVPLSPSVIVLAPVVVATVPATLTPDGAVAVTPPVNVVESPESSPTVNAPVLLNVTASVTELTAPVSETASTVLFTVSVSRVTLPEKPVVPPRFCNTKVSTATDVALTSASATLSPVSSVSVKLPAPSLTAPREMSPAVVVASVSIVVLAANVTFVSGSPIVMPSLED